MAKIYTITKNYSAFGMTLIDLVGIFKDRGTARAFWQKNCAGKDGYKFEDTETDLV